ncbi:MAG: hypothetical protein D3909_17450, partial [Candidatus Electrothrix sp. ATG1]|nr:hypothetical protein [Candidatus Electrothrix sp. ATG1]
NIKLRLVEPSSVHGKDITTDKSAFEKVIKILLCSAEKVIYSDCESVVHLFFNRSYVTVMKSLCDNKLCKSCKEYMYLRLTSSGALKPCLSRRDTEVEIPSLNEITINNSFAKAIAKMGIGLLDEVEQTERARNIKKCWLEDTGISS